jgi:integrase
MPVSAVNESLWLGFFNHLDRQRGTGELSETTCKNRQVAARAFINYLFEQGSIPALPRNLKSKALSFRGAAQEVEPADLQEVKKILELSETASFPLKLYLLLMINTGMQQADIAELTPFQVDWALGTISRKRTKSRNREKAPTVTYKLWDETLRLLDENNSERDDWVLVTSAGTPLLVRGVRAGKPTKKDMIQTQFWRWNKKNQFVCKFQLKQLRTTSASLLERHTEFAQYVPLFLGQAQNNGGDMRSMKLRQNRFDAAVKWLGEQYGF